MHQFDFEHELGLLEVLHRLVGVMETISVYKCTKFDCVAEEDIFIGIPYQERFRLKLRGTL